MSNLGKTCASKIELFINENNTMRFTRTEISRKLTMDSQTVLNRCRQLVAEGKIQMQRIKNWHYFFALDYVEPVALVGHVAESRTAPPVRAWRPCKAMLAQMERIDLSRAVKTMASNVMPPQNYFLAGGVGAFK